MNVPFSKKLIAPVVPRYEFEAEMGNGEIIKVFADNWKEALDSITRKYYGTSMVSIRLLKHSTENVKE